MVFREDNHGTQGVPSINIRGGGHEQASVRDRADGGSIGHRHRASIGESKEALPTLKERLTRDTIKGTLMRTEGEYYYIKDNDGIEQKIHVDKSTKLEKVMPGDMVKACVNDQGHTTTLERVN